MDNHTSTPCAVLKTDLSSEAHAEIVSAMTDAGITTTEGLDIIPEKVRDLFVKYGILGYTMG